MTDITSTRRRAIRLLAALTAAAAVATLTLAPRSIVAPARGAFMRAMDAVTAVFGWMPVADAERVLNTVMFVPLGATIALLLSRRAWPLAIVAALALSTAVEHLQDAIPGRVPDPTDVLWNTLGGAIGVVAVTVPRLIAAIVRSARQRGSLTRT